MLMNMDYTVNEAKKEIKDSINIYMMMDENGEYIIPENKKNPFYLIGAPGIGKTEMVGQIARELGLEFMATSLTHHTRNSVLGLPVITEVNGEKSTEYTMPDILAQIVKINASQKKEGILLIDEFASMSEALVAPMLAFLQNKCIGNHKLPEGWVMVLCSNPPEYNETAREFDAAVLDRIRIMNIVYSKEDFLKYGEENNFHPIVLDYVRDNSTNVYVCDTEAEDKQIVTTRGWENLSQCLYGYEKINSCVSARLVYQFIKSEKIANDFYNYYCLKKTEFGKVSIDNVMAGVDVKRNVDIVSAMEYTNKLHVVDVIKRKLLDNIKTSVKQAKTREYLKWWISEWENKGKNEQVQDSNAAGITGIFDVASDYYSIIKTRVNEITYAMTPLSMPSVCNDKEYDDMEEKMLKEILREAEELSRNRGSLAISDEAVMFCMKKWYKDSGEKTENALKRDSVRINNAVKFISSISDRNIMEMFLRNLNNDDSFIYIIGRIRIPAYVEQMSVIYDVA